MHDELQGRLSRRDARLPELPRQQFNESLDRKGDIARAFAAHQTSPAALTPHRRHVVHNERDLTLRVAYDSEVAKAAGKSDPEMLRDWDRENFVPPKLRDEFRDIDMGQGDDELDRPSAGPEDLRGDLERSWEQLSEGR